MPLYDFRCRACGATYEERAAIGELAPCPECGNLEVERIVSGFAGPFTTSPRGRAARRSDDTRRLREERRGERKATRPQQRNDG